ncbi:MAG: septal ring lytic transglycosylase RlpA family protein [Candidatus Omnitrophota bacterium]|nr:septal ring lytic transglycosylase RlpA family protein [Candidatus Omnitrophota bacterium]
MKRTLSIIIVLLLVNGIFSITALSYTDIYRERDVFNYRGAGVASYYSYECADQPMANGRIFDPEKRTCASWFYDFGTVLLVKSLETGRVTEVVVTDRGPNKRLVREGRIIDLSKRAFQDICRLEKGLTKVTIAVKK